MDSSSDDDESEVGRGSLDHLPDVRGTTPRASASGPAFPGEGGEDASGLAIACPEAEADMPKTRALGKRAVSLMGSMVEVERATVGATQQPLWRVERALEPGEGRPVPTDTGAAQPPLPLPLSRTRDTVWKLLFPRLSQKHQAEAPALAPRKVLKVSTSSTAQWVVEAQAAIQHGVVSARANPKEPVAQGEATEAATKQAGEEAPMPHEAEARELDEAEAPSVAEATEGEAEAPRTSEAEAAEAGASRPSEAEVAEASVRVTKPVA
ncbi:fruit protein pKIWI501-like [Miscanthus floridulus]|uniref:fruit protein pKIWI501-like n=1 Tax=Miscanthus floridulus TaxID=154761 RepID=UPI0034579B57